MTLSRSASTFADGLARRGIHYGWVVIAATFLTRFGASRVSAFALRLIAAGVARSFTMTSHRAFPAAGGLGTGFTAMVLGATIVTRWSGARGGQVLGLLCTGAAMGQVLFMPTFAALEQARGWRTALSLLLAMLGPTTAIIAVLMRDKPSDVGLLPHGATETPVDSRQTKMLATTLLMPLRVFAEAAKSGTFFICGTTTIGLVQAHLVSICGGCDIAPLMAAWKLAAETFGTNATIVFGWIFFGHQPRSALAAWGAGLTRSASATDLPAFYAAGALCLIAALAVFAIRRAQPCAKLQTA